LLFSTFYKFLFFFIFQFSETGQQTMSKIGGKDSLYMEGIEAKFQFQPSFLIGLGGIFPHL